MHMATDLTDGLIRTLKILLIENDAETAAELCHQLNCEATESTEGWQIHLAPTLAAGFEMLSQLSYDAILLDLSLPDSQGLETLLAVIKKYPDLPIVATTDQDDQQLGMQTVHYGAQDYLVKGKDQPAVIKRSLLHSIERQKLVNSFHHAALHDPLTNLANRNLFLTLVQQALDRKARNPEQLFAVLFLDLDHFKHINDRHGHLAGDLLLAEIALRLKASVRASDVVSRLAGDEFGILIEDLQEPLDVLPVVHRISQIISRPFRVPSGELEITASLGVALSNLTGEKLCHTAIELLESADLAMYQAKLNGKAGYYIYNEHMDHEKQVLTQLEASLKSDFSHSDLLRMGYRPVISVQDGHLFGLETDIQCQSNSWQSVPFSELLGLAGGSGMLDALNAWLCEEVSSQLAHWDKQADHGWKVFVHLAPEQLKARELHAQLESLLLARDLPPGRFYLSLKESMFQNTIGYQDLLPLLKQLHRQGFRLYLEDFGGSYTVLNTISQIPVDMVKINLDELSSLLPAHAVSDRFLVLAPVIQLAHNLGMQIMVDGIRTAEDLSRLQALEAVFAQGSYFSPLLSAKDVEAWL